MLWISGSFKRVFTQPGPKAVSRQFELLVDRVQKADVRNDHIIDLNMTVTKFHEDRFYRINKFSKATMLPN